MKTHQKRLFHALITLLIISVWAVFGTGCSNECITQWADCYNRCPTQEDGDRAVRDCIDDCLVKYPNGQPVEAFSQCAVACYNKSREACVDRCGDALERCLDE